MLSALRLRHALLLLVGLGGALVPAALSSGCGPEAVGVEPCRKIESARCEAAAACGFTEEDVADCKLVYHDQCLHGVENASHRPTEGETEACVAAVTAVGACAAAGAESMTECPEAPVIAGAPNRAPCEVVLTQAHELAACAFATAPVDAGTTTDSGSDAADAADGD